METKAIKSKDEIIKEVKNYLTKTAKHLFITGNGYFYKIETFEKDGKLYYATILMGKDNIKIYVSEAAPDRQIVAYEANTLSVLQQTLFPKYMKLKSIPYFKAMKELIGELMGKINVNNTVNAKLADSLYLKFLDLTRNKK